MPGRALIEDLMRTLELLPAVSVVRQAPTARQTLCGLLAGHDYFPLRIVRSPVQMQECYSFFEHEEKVCRRCFFVDFDFLGELDHCCPNWALPHPETLEELPSWVFEPQSYHPIPGDWIS